MNRSLRAAMMGCSGLLLLNACASAGPAIASAAPPPATQSVAASLSETPEPTPSPAVTPSPLPAPTLPPVGMAPELACELNWQHPINGTKLEPRSDFTVRWNVTNTGSADWRPGEVEFQFVGGTAMHYSPVLALPESVAPGQSITLSVDMKALRNTSSYITTWALHQGGTYFCTLSTMIYVQWENDSERNW